MKIHADNLPDNYINGEEKARTTNFIDQLRENVRCFKKAAELAKQAVAAASSDQYITYAYYDLTVEGIERPTCKEYAEMNYSIINLAAMFGASRANLLRSVQLTQAMEASDDEASKKALHKEHTQLVEEDLILQEEVLAMFEDFKQRAPYLTRVGITGRQIEDLINKQHQKLDELS
jgi:hypothetical protein